MTRTRSVRAILGDPQTTVSHFTPLTRRLHGRKRNGVPCPCCKSGDVDPRTRSKHVQQEHDTQSPVILDEMMFDDGSSGSPDAFLVQETSAFQNPLAPIRKRQNSVGSLNSATEWGLEEEHEDYDSAGDSWNSEGEWDNNESERGSSEGEEDGSDVPNTSATFEDYSAPPLPLHSKGDKPPVTSNSWDHIVLWILRWQAQFKIPASAIDLLIKFLGVVFRQPVGNLDDFPSSLYMVRKSFGLDDLFVQYVACTACHKLYTSDKVVGHKENNLPAVLHCSHKEFPNNPGRLRKCGASLSEMIELTRGGTILRPRMVYPYAHVIEQLKRLYARPAWEASLRKWVNRKVDEGTYSDLYDGSVWRELPADIHQPQAEKFFCPEKADSNIGFVLNLDWFQPFEGTTHSTGVLYLVVANLPREERYRQENTLVVGILPGPKEASLHQLNHYLAPLVDELEKLWTGISIPTREHEAGRMVRGALIACTCDLPAARKIVGHASVRSCCHLCNIIPSRGSFGGMKDYKTWESKDPVEHRQEAVRWRQCKTVNARKEHVRQTHIRWSELLRLEYFDPVAFVPIDVMHCLYLGIASWLVKSLWIPEGKISRRNLEKIEETMQRTQVPQDIGRIPRKVAIGDEGFSGLTADQWRTFFTVFAAPTMWDLLPVHDCDILAYFVRACTILSSRILNDKQLREAQRCIFAVVKLIEHHYGEERITPNLHLSLHVTSCCRKYGPPCAFWCFAFERMNGTLGKYMVKIEFTQVYALYNKL
jgi:hypothetical protein